MKQKTKIKLCIGGALALVLTGAGALLWRRLNDSTPSKSTITISKETTFVDGPVDEFGYVDYVKALDRRYSEGVTADNNAAIPMLQALGPSLIPRELRAEYFERLGVDVPPDSRDCFQSRPDEAATEKFNRLIRRPWKRADSPALAGWLQQSSKPLEIIAKASKLPRCYSPLISKERLHGRQAMICVLLPMCGVMPDVIRAFCLRAMLRLGNGQNEQAIDDLMTCHRLNRLIDQNPFLIGCVVAIAGEKTACEVDIAAANSGRLSKAELTGFQNKLQSLPPLSRVPIRIDQAERMVLLDIITFQARNGPDAAQILDGATTSNRQVDAALERGILKFIDWDEVLKSVNRFYDRAFDVAKLTDRAIREREYSALSSELEQMVEDAKNLEGDELTRKFGNIFVGLLFPGIRGAWNAEDQQRMRLQMTILTFALARHHLDTGTYPNSLDSLAPKYASRLPSDIFSGKPLIYVPLKSGYRLTSVGVNGQDDENRSPAGSGPVDDITIRVP